MYKYAGMGYVLFDGIAESEFNAEIAINNGAIKTANFDLVEYETKKTARDLGELMAKEGKIKLHKGDRAINMDAHYYGCKVIVLTPDELEKLIDNVRRVEQAGGFGKREIR